jgi:capsid protein
MNIIDRTVGVFNPFAGLQRHFARKALKKVVDTNMSYRQLRPTTRNRGLETSAGSEEQEINSWDRQKLIATMRKQKRENSLVHGIINRVTDNVCGSDGPMLQFTTEDEKYNEDIEQWWKAVSREIEARGVLSFGEYIRVAHMEQFAVGDMGTIKLDSGKIQGIESERISTPDDMRGRDDVIEGVKIDFIGVPEKYWVGRRGNYAGHMKDHKPFDAKDFYLHYRPDRFDMVRGVSELFSNLENIYDLEEYLMVEKQGAKFASLFGVKTKNMQTEDKEESLLGQIATNGESVKKKAPKVEVGSILNVELHGEEDIEFMDNNRPGPQFSPFVQIMSRLIGVGVDLPIELVLLDFKQASFSSIRGALNEARRSFLARRVAVTKLASHIFEWRLKMAFEKKELREIKKHGMRYEWLYPGWGMLNPQVEIMAAGDAIDKGLSHLKGQSAVLGFGDWKANLLQRKKEIDFCKKNDIPIVLSKPGAAILGQENQNNNNSNTNNKPAE